MEGLLHPVGPEGVRTYWIRRGVTLSVLMAVFVSVGFMISNIGSADGSAVSPEETVVPVSAAEPIAQPPAANVEPPAPAVEGVPADIANEEAVPVPTRTTADADADKDEPLPPEPANTFHLDEAPNTASAG